MKIRKIVLTGGPCAGKSTIVEMLAERFGRKIVVVPEMASALFRAGWPAPDPWTQEWQDLFQAAVISGQFGFETKAEEDAKQASVKIVVCDRGVLDGAAYLTGGVAEFCQRFRVDEANALAQYETVIHLESLSTLNPGLYLDLAKTNPNRFESLAMASEREFRLRQAWQNHPDRVMLSGRLGDSAEQIVDIIERLIR